MESHLVSPKLQIRVNTLEINPQEDLDFNNFEPENWSKTKIDSDFTVRGRKTYASPESGALSIEIHLTDGVDFERLADWVYNKIKGYETGIYISIVEVLDIPGRIKPEVGVHYTLDDITHKELVLSFEKILTDPPDAEEYSQ